MRWKYLAGPVLATAIAVGCSSDPQPAAGPDTTPSENTVEATDQTPSSTAATSTAPVVTSDAPASLAFASSRDLGRIFEVAGSVRGYVEPDVSTAASTIAGGTLVQAVHARNIDGVLWVSVAGAGETESLGWVEASDLVETTQVLTTFEPDDLGQLRQVSSAIDGDLLSIVSQPGAENAAVATLQEGEIGMHGGNTALTGSGESWVDVIDINSQIPLGWVRSTDFRPLSKSQVRTAENAELDRRPADGITYGASLPAGAVTATGCNASQITFRNSDSSRGLAILFGTENPTGREIRGVERWTASGGTTVYVDPGASAVFTLQTKSANTWYFASLDAEGRAQSGGPDSDGRMIATAAQSFFLSKFTCGEVVAQPSADTVPPENRVDEPVEEETAEQPTETSADAGSTPTTTTTTPPSGDSPASSG